MLLLLLVPAGGNCEGKALSSCSPVHLPTPAIYRRTMALTIATLLQKTTMIVGDTLLPETTHAALTIALECDDLLAFSKCQKTFVASAVGGVYAAIVVSQMENIMRVAALATNPELAGFEAFSDESAGETGAQGTWTQGHDTDKTIPIDKELQAQLHAVNMQDWKPPPVFKLPDGTAQDVKLGATARAKLSLDALSDFLTKTGPYPSTGRRSQKKAIALACGKVIPSSFLEKPENSPNWDWGDEIWRWKAKVLVRGSKRYHALVLVPAAAADGAVADADLEARVIAAVRAAVARGDVGWVLSSQTLEETRTSQQAVIDEAKAISEAANLEAERQLSSYQKSGGVAGLAVGGGGGGGGSGGGGHVVTKLAVGDEVKVFGKRGIISTTKGPKRKKEKKQHAESPKAAVRQL